MSKYLLGLLPTYVLLRYALVKNTFVQCRGDMSIRLIQYVCTSPITITKSHVVCSIKNRKGDPWGSREYLLFTNVAVYSLDNYF